MQAFAEMQALETRLEGLTKEVAERTDYESDSYAQLIQNSATPTNVWTPLALQAPRNKPTGSSKVWGSK